MTSPQPPILPAQQISLLDIYAKQIEMGADLRLLKDTLPDHESRIRALERFRFTIVGAAITISAVFSGLGTWIGIIVTHK